MRLSILAVAALATVATASKYYVMGVSEVYPHLDFACVESELSACYSEETSLVHHHSPLFFEHAGGLIHFVMYILF